MRKIWHEDSIQTLSSFCNLQNNYQDIIPEVLKFVDDNQRILEEWRLDKWVDDRNLGRVKLWDGDWRVIPFPIDCVDLLQLKKILNSVRWLRLLSCSIQ